MTAKNLILRKYNKSLIIADVDHDNEVAVNIIGLGSKKDSVYLDKQSLESLRDHINYLIKKIEENEDKSN